MVLRSSTRWHGSCQEMVVTSPDSMQRLIDQGMASRTVGSTAMNDTSSRSHSVFTVKVRRGYVAINNRVGNVLFWQVQYAG